MAVDAEGRLWQGPTPTDTFRNIFQDATQDGASITAPALMPIAAAAKFQRVFCRPNASQTFALDAHGRLWGFGRNSFGELGDGDGDGFTSNQAVTTIKPLTDRNWIDIGVGVGGVTVGVAGDGTLWAWGNNSSGQLGTGNREYRDRPTLVDARPIWRAAAVSHSMAAALTRDGQIYVWGAGSVRNPRGETLYLLGDGGVADVRLTPTPVASTVIWKKGS
jgi:alpha-tubulin suppressor-like RCC1 family protein